LKCKEKKDTNASADAGGPNASRPKVNGLEIGRKIGEMRGPICFPGENRRKRKEKLLRKVNRIKGGMEIRPLLKNVCQEVGREKRKGKRIQKAVLVE